MTTIKRAAIALFAALSIALPVFLAPSASAIETPEPDSRTWTFRVTVTHPVETATIAVTSAGVSANGEHCVSVYSRAVFPPLLGSACSLLSSTVLVPITIDARTFPLGRSQIDLVDEAGGPPRTMPDSAWIEVRRLSVFGRGLWQDKGMGNLHVVIPIKLKNPITGKLVPQQKAPVQIQRLINGRWRRLITIYSVNGIAARTWHIGPGRFKLRAYRPLGATVTSVTGIVRDVNVNQEPIGL